MIWNAPYEGLFVRILQPTKIFWMNLVRDTDNPLLRRVDSGISDLHPSMMSVLVGI